MIAIIIDDEARARNLLRTILADYCPEINEIFEAEDLVSGVKLIKELKPNIVFLDVEMPTYLGTQILDFFEEREITFNIVFTTAYNNYALKAFEINALSYLLKPLRPKQVKEAVKKVAKKISSEQIFSQLKELNNAVSFNKITKIALPVKDGVFFIKHCNIYYFKADGMYTEIHSFNNDKLLISKPLKYFVDLLSDVDFFFRCHRSFFINIQHIKQIVKKDGNYILMENDAVVNVSKEKLTELLTLYRV